ncbi:helix-turn-helix transcriptional regulator [Microbacterium elymi]|uniref:Helix-turn-helix transcriptional regulator n=1 Tax=Microbacterium elymi TaxID=2909587 RepID=A0ABY5NGU6_9MICO|nr:helix-turn-helix transcriptional regulator [Microbacterium elymi]UUT34383.1 helix-turn-helix transcriptional regulator [Microbacterium elymi]
MDRTELDLLDVDAVHLSVARTPAEVARTAATRHIVVVQLSGTSVLTPADGHPPVRLEPGMVSYGDPTVSYGWEFDGPFRLMMLRAPRAALPLAPAALRPVLGRPFPADRGYARIAVRFARDVLDDAALLAGSSGSGILHDVVGVFSTMLAEQLAAADVIEPTEPAFRRATAYISAHLTGTAPGANADPLRVTTIAEAVDISPRYLQALFHERDMSVTGWIRERRLELARQALVDPGWADADILQIALAHGFANHSHFTRSFRAAFGETPSAWRRAAA